MIYPEEDFLQLSGLQHFKFCRRQWALIYIENQWAENFRTTDGAILHENATTVDLPRAGETSSSPGICAFFPGHWVCPAPAMCWNSAGEKRAPRKGCVD